MNEKRLVMNEFYAIDTISEFNSSESCFRRHDRHKLQKRWIQRAAGALITPAISLPCVITLTRVATRLLDEKDNLRGAFKWIADYIADAIIPGLAPGRADGDPGFTWLYDQKVGSPKGVWIKIEEVC